MDFKVVPLLFFILQYVDGASRIDPLVDSKIGFIRGVRAENGQYSMFMGIPYATVHSGNPFGPSVPHPGFNYTFEAYDDSTICPQMEDSVIRGNLDCLHLNIYIPNSATSKNRLPVLAWIHGGAFNIGSAGRYYYGPEFLMRQDIILVTLNYRLGPYGFMCLDTPEVPGNQGLKDQRLALKWIKDNIESFGGDVDRITIFGESAGSASVDFHLRYSDEKLFHRVIMQSGSAVAPWAIKEPDRAAPLKLASYLGYVTNNTAEALSFLSSVDTSLVIAAASDINLKLGPCVEQSDDIIDKFITEHPLNKIIPRAKEIPILIGYNDDEGSGDNVKPEYYNGLNIFREYLETYFTFDEENFNEMEKKIRNFYNGDKPLDVNARWNIFDFYSDFFFTHPTERSIKYFLENAVRNIFFYVFSYGGERYFVPNINNETIGGAKHTDELGYLFDLAYVTEEPTTEDKLIIDRITTLWANFAKFGNPTVETSELLPILWPPITEDTRIYMNIDTEIRLAQRPFSNRMSFWDLFYKLNYNYVNGYSENLRNLSTSGNNKKYI